MAHPHTTRPIVCPIHVFRKELLVSHRVQNVSEFATAVAGIAGGVVYVYDPPNRG